MRWYDQNPNPNPGFIGKARWSAHQWGRQQFASSFARGGFAATAFAPTAGEAMAAPWRMPLQEGSAQHLTNLRKIQAAHPGNTKLSKTISNLEQSGSKARIFGGIASLGLGAAFTLAPFFTTPGGLYEKAKGSMASAAYGGGALVGSKLGAGVGALIGGPIGAVAGWLIGGAIGGSAAEGAFSTGIGVMDRAVQRERDKRQLGWVNNQTAFMTQGAFTMRQQSLQAMNRGMMNARSMLGREGMMLHQ